MSSSSLMRVGLVFVVGAASLAQAAAADVDAGKRLTDQICSNCHVVGASGRGTDAAPTLPAIAQQKGKDPNWLKAWLETPHPPMPNFNLSRQQIDDISAYLASLQKR